ncbi:Putative uncharacterized protein [Taphrina deformans PYCC 5710]|uniref:Uncharacterized protein n=1 Tax=Taphrina deformans (strain PYCC 5710 / ATCC 11124 / CBS 356.35 / IMI 108563 / JCM 9778 / NBRC 8474) TaxID=1097556 RepID=R4XE03_TAPDE|nr:Putative uncharacterized protein [Taphrina deformans PYCC 5710]|eukprot:CCG82650.1 Putative uncharacterized protein [Taphrina deformans PYCC 5710]
MSRIIARSLKIVGGTIAVASSVTVGSYLLTTRKTNIIVFPPTDIEVDSFSRLNPNGNPTLHDLATRRLPLNKLPQDIQDHVRNGSGQELTRRFCAGVWAGSVFSTQRDYLAQKYRHLPGREDQLWTTHSMLESEYEVGTKVVDHFEVVESECDHITMRCGDSPLNQAVRAADGLFTMSVVYLPESEEVEFRLRCIFWDGISERLDRLDSHATGPMPEWMVILHEIYTKLLMESSVRSLVDRN